MLIVLVLYFVYIIRLTGYLDKTYTDVFVRSHLKYEYDFGYETASRLIPYIINIKKKEAQRPLFIHTREALNSYQSRDCTSFGIKSLLTCPHSVHLKTGIGMYPGFPCPVRMAETLLITIAWSKYVPLHSSHKTGVV